MRAILVDMDKELPSAPPLPGNEPPEATRSEHMVVEPTPYDEPDTLNEHVIEPGDPDGLVEADQARAEIEQSSREPVKPAEQPTPGKTVHKLVWILVAVSTILLIGTAAYWFGVRRPVSTSNVSPTVSKQPKKTMPVVGATKHYESDTYTLSFDYPENWIVSDTATSLTVQSSKGQLSDVKKGTVPGKIILSIQSQQSTIPNFPSGGAVAALNSDKLSYAKPTAVQRAQTYESYLSYNGAANSIDRIFLTGDNDYQAGQLVPLSDIVRSNPLVSVSFVMCTTSDCAISDNPTYTSVHATDWPTSAYSQQVSALLKSLQFN